MKEVELLQKVLDSAIWASRWKGSAKTSIAYGMGMLTGGVLDEVLYIMTKRNSKFIHGAATLAMLEGAFMILFGICDNVYAKAEYKKQKQYFDMYTNKEYEPDDEE